MPATPRSNSKITLVHPPALPDDRQALARAIAQVKASEADLQKLRDALDRATTQRHQHAAALADRETLLTALRDKEVSRARAAFVENQPDISPLPQAEAAVHKAQTELTKIAALEDSIETEITACEQRLQHQRRQLDERVGELLATSPELAALNREIRDCWMRLRTLRAAMIEVNHLIPGSAPHRQLADWEAVEPIVPAVGYAVDDALIRQWTDAVTALHDDPAAELPGGDR